ncbi:hypothetical protein CAPTEDRAFT_3682 [Capitella teleta]|uniref:Neurotransmitter-gated ion-channel ligand-binding domain-containing protein n=1 Tax=Capitella teleta TaxID=283909 RepID=R7VBN0_CAPTE|nr:hypothetical protein CAPTEDRAFT_3682 [Capitella teleta]|eukprot:ELU16044.1 hypothetical protein CAPTEDRAFT_3682 [Capitella teleta]
MADAPPPPSAPRDRPTEVSLGIYVNSFYSISEQTMDYSVSIYLRQAWRDPRLQFSLYGKKKTIKLANGWDHVWVPDTFFRNEKRADFHQITVPNRLMNLDRTGHVWYVTKISAALSCPMQLHSYPMDTQICPLMFESFGYTMDIMYFSWLDTPVEIDAGLQLPQGAFPCLEIRFVLRRDIGYFLIQVYVPSILIVILSWVSFWINIEATPARVSLGLLTVLTMTTQSSGARTTLPRVSYIKAIDVWMSTCLVFVFTSLLEFAFVNVVSRKNHARAHTEGKGNEGKLKAQKIDKFSRNRQRRDGTTKPLDPEGKFKARRIDKVSRKAFPLAFLLFNIVYWIMYTLPSQEADLRGS